MIKLINILKHILKEQEEIAQDQFLGAPEEPAPTPEEPSGTIDVDTAKKLIFDTKGKFFTVTFIKKDGTERKMNARLQVRKYLKGGELRYNPSEMGYIAVYDMQAKGYRMVNTNTIKTLKIGKKEYVIPGAIAESKEEHELVYLINESQLNENDLKLYYDILMDVGGEDLAGEYKDVLSKSQEYNSFSDFVKNDLSILAQDDEDQVNEIKANFVENKLRKMSPKEFTTFTKIVGDYDFWSDAPKGINPFNNIGQRMDILSTNTPEDNDRYFNALMF
jgi:hypothetical protein